MLEPVPRTITWLRDAVRGSEVISRGDRAAWLFRSLLDILIAIYASGLASIALVGGGEFGGLSFHRAEKPILVLMVLVPLRIAIGGRSWLAEAIHGTRHHLASSWGDVSSRIPPAVLDSLFAVLAVRLASSAAAFLANLAFEPAIPRGFTLPFSNAKFVEIFAAWDSGWYWDIATRGYYFRPDAESSIAFFPLYPTLMRLAAAPFGGGDAATWVAGIAVALAADLCALIAIHRLAERIFGSREVARRTVLYIAVFPWSLFLTRVYSESVFLLTSALAITCAYDRRWWQAGAWGALATLARPNGILIALPLVIYAIADRPSIRQLGSRAAAFAPIPLAFAGFCAYVFTLTGDPLGWISAQSHWGYSLGHPPWQQLQRVIGAFVEHGAYDYFFTSDIASFELLHAATALIFLALTPLIFRRLGAAMGGYVLVSLLVPLSSNALEGLGRYASVLFPAFMLVGSMTTTRSHEALVMTSLVFRTLLMFLFVNWRPVY